MVGICHFKGDDGEEDEIAMDWFEKAADNGHDEAQYMMGFCYFNGIGTDPDEDEAAYWLRLAAAQGHEDARQTGIIAGASDRMHDLSIEKNSSLRMRFGTS